LLKTLPPFREKNRRWLSIRAVAASSREACARARFTRCLKVVKRRRGAQRMDGGGQYNRRQKKKQKKGEMDVVVVAEAPDELLTERVLRVDEAFCARAIFVKVKCKAGVAPSQLSHHPELRLRFSPRPVDGAPLIANGVSIQVSVSSSVGFLAGLFSLLVNP